MFVKNRTRFEVALPHGHLVDGLSVAALALTVAYRITPKGLELHPTRAPLPTDPPDATEHALWHGASVTATGTVFGPGRVPHITYADLRIGAESRRLVVTGARRWLRNAGKLIASAPAPWDTMPLSWSLAFGGAVDLPPGPIGPEKLPHPGGRFQYPLNPGGKGLALDEAAAEGASLPNIESPDCPMKAPLEQPRPAGFAPCPDLTALRMPAVFAPDLLDDVERALRMSLRTSHAAPGELIFDSLSAGTAIELTGVGERPILFDVPPCPVSVTVHKGKKATPLPATIRSVHVSADDAAVLVCFGHSFSYETAPSWVVVAEA